jgi:hypothetical protein
MKLPTKRLLLAGAAALVGLGATGCSAREIQMWVDWHDQDPVAAEEFANQPEVQADLHSGEHEGGGEAAAEEQVSSGRGGCDGIYDEMRRQGASDAVAQRFAYRIAPRESGCNAAFVHDHDDWSYSRFGLNGLTAGLRANWASWCGADVRSDTKNLSTDVNCALEAYNRMGWAPWG